MPLLTMFSKTDSDAVDGPKVQIILVLGRTNELIISLTFSLQIIRQADFQISLTHIST